MDFKQQADKFAVLSDREKTLVLVAGAIVLIALLFTLLIEPISVSLNKAKTELASVNAEVASLEMQTELYKTALQNDPNAPVKEQLAHLERTMVSLDAEFSAQLADLILPQEMPILIEDVFSQAKGLKLIEMASVTPMNIFADRPDMADIPLYQHGVSLTFEGRFFAVRNFMDSLEQLNSKVYWRSMAYQVTDYPQAEVTLEVYTLSTEKAFIGVE